MEKRNMPRFFGPCVSMKMDVSFLIVQQEKIEQMREFGMEIPEYMLESQKEQMEITLNYLYENYGTVESYLEDIGLAEEEIRVLKEKLCV